MPVSGKGAWELLGAWRATAFVVAGVLFVPDIAILVYNLAAGTQEQYLTLGQAFIGAAWTAGFVGLLGFYPDLADRSKWLSRVGGVFAVVGLVAMAAMALVSFGLVGGLVGGTLADYTTSLLPGVFLGIVLGFGSYGVACLLTSTYRRSVGLLCLVLVATFLFNLGTGIAGFNPLGKVLGVVVVLTLANLALGYVLGTGGTTAPRAGGAAPDSTA